MKTKVTWKQNMEFEGIAESGYILPLDARKENGGEDLGFRPMELVAIGVASCTAMDVISILKKKKQDVTDFEVNLEAERSPEHPKRFLKILIEYVVSGHQIDMTAVERSIELSETKYCAAIATLRAGVEFQHKIRIIDAVTRAAESE